MTANINEKTVKLPPVRVFRGDDGGDTIAFECARAYGALDLRFRFHEIPAVGLVRGKSAPAKERGRNGRPV